MKRYRIGMLLPLSLILLNGCAPMNTHFSCNATAEDKCLSIEEVNAMTEAVERHEHRDRGKMSAQPQRGMQQQHAANNPHVIWMAPWTDAKGHRHEHDLLTTSVG